MTGQITSILVPAALLSPQQMAAKRQVAYDEVMRVAQEDLRGVEITLRALVPIDLGESNNIWADQTGSTANTWENTIIASQTIANERFIAIYGMLDTSEANVVAALRWTVGHTIVAQWSLFDYFTDEVTLRSRLCYAETPIVIRQNTPVTIEQYLTGSASTNKSVHFAYLGAVAEKAGRTLKA